MFFVSFEISCSGVLVAGCLACGTANSKDKVNNIFPTFPLVVAARRGAEGRVNLY